MNRHLLCLLVLALLAPAAWAQAPMPQAPALPLNADRLAALDARRDSLIDFFADQVPADDFTRGGYLHLAADLYRGQDLAWVTARLDSLLAQPPRGDMFWMYPVATLMYAGRDRLPEAYRRRLRDLWRTYMPYRGDTENHWAMYYASLYLVAQMYPGEPGSSWYTGKSSAENRAEAEEYLIEWMRITSSIGQGEYDSPGYMSFYVAPMAMLYAWADDPAMKLRAQMMLDWLLADFAVDNLQGIYMGASSRIYPKPLLDRWHENATAYSWLLFGNTAFYPRGEAAILAMSGYRLPEVLYRIANDRQRPYVQKEYKRTRHRIRNSPVKNWPVYRYLQMRPEYGLSSTQGGILQPIQQLTWELMWRTDDPQAGGNMFFVTHPYSSPKEGTMYFSEPWDMVTDLIARSKTEFDQADKWTGGSDYEQVVQHEDALIALYDIAPGARFPHVSGFFSKNLTRREEDPSGWIFAQGGQAYFAYYPLAPYEWRQEADGHWRLHSPHLQNGGVLQVAPAADYPSFDAFKAAVRALPLETATRPRPRVRFQTLGGDVLVAAYGETPTVNGRPVDYDGWKLFDGPYLYAERGSHRLEMRYGTLRRTLDFNTLSITDAVVPAEERAAGSR